MLGCPLFASPTKLIYATLHRRRDHFAKQLVPIPVEVAMLLAAVPPLVASGTFSAFLVRCAGVTGRVVTALGSLI